MRLNDVLKVTEVVQTREELAQYGNTPLGVFAEAHNVFSTKDNYARRERLVRQWASEEFGEDYTEGMYRAVNGLRRTRESKSYLQGYTHGRRLIERLG